MNLFGLFKKNRSPRIIHLTEQAANRELKAWRVIALENTETDLKTVFRIRMSKPEHPDVGMLQTAAVIRWNYQSGSPMPSPSVNELQLELERLLDPLTGENGNSEIVQVTTGMGTKEWLFYCWSSELFMKQLNAVLKMHPAYPIKIEFYADPEWNIWREVAASLREKMAD